MTAALQSSSKAGAFQQCHLYYSDQAQLARVERLQVLVIQHKLSLTIAAELIVGKLTQKRRAQLNADAIDPILLLDEKNKLSWLSGGLSVAPEWDKLRRRVVSAGRKSELLLQAAKVTADSYVIDATAGFGHDSLILASTGAQVIMLEQQPLMALLLLAEQQRMSAEPNWQKLMARLTIINADAYRYLSIQNAIINNANKHETINNKMVDVIYLDPMFPEDSYQDSSTGKGAKVGKQMQALHQLVYPPTLDQERQLLHSAQAVVAQNHGVSGRVIVKRPQQAPFLANESPDESWHNAAVRFDGYFL